MIKTATTGSSWGCPVLRTEHIRQGTFEQLADGIIVCSPSGENMGLQDARELLALITSMTPAGRKSRLLLDQRKVRRTIAPEAKRFLAEHGEEQERVAIVVGNAISRFFASTLIAMDGSGSRMKVFDDVESALRWLREGLR